MGKWLSGATELTIVHSAKLQMFDDKSCNIMFDTQLHSTFFRNNTHAYPGNITGCKLLLFENMQKVICYIPVL